MDEQQNFNNDRLRINDAPASEERSINGGDVITQSTQSERDAAFRQPAQSASASEYLGCCPMEITGAGGTGRNNSPEVAPMPQLVAPGGAGDRSAVRDQGPRPVNEASTPRLTPSQVVDRLTSPEETANREARIRERMQSYNLDGSGSSDAAKRSVELAMGALAPNTSNDNIPRGDRAPRTEANVPTANPGESNLDRIRRAEDPNARPEDLSALTRDSNPQVRRAVAENLNTNPNDLTRLSRDKDTLVRRSVAYHPNLPETDRQRLAEDREPVVRYAVQRYRRGGGQL